MVEKPCTIPTLYPPPPARQRFWGPKRWWNSQMNDVCVLRSKVCLQNTFPGLCMKKKNYLSSCCLHAQSLSRVWLLVTPWPAARQAPRSLGFSRQEHWSGVPCPPPGGLPHPGMDLLLACLLHWLVGSWPLAPPGKPIIMLSNWNLEVYLL